MRRHPLLTAGTVAGVAGLALVVFGVVAGTDLGLGYLLLQAVFLGLAVLLVACVVLMLIEAYSRPRD